MLTAPCRHQLSEMKNSEKFSSCWNQIRSIPLTQVRKRDALGPYQIQRLLKAESVQPECFYDNIKGDNIESTYISLHVILLYTIQYM